MGAPSTSSVKEEAESQIAAALFGPGPYMVIRRQIELLKGLSNFEKKSILRICVALSIETVNFDEDWYISAYPDVRDAIKQENFKSGLAHFRSMGYFEGRLPVNIVFDENFYLGRYADISQAINLGSIPSAKLHFFTRGYKEGRIPSPSYRFSRPCATTRLEIADRFIRTEDVA